MGYNPREHVCELFDLNACVKMTEMFIYKKTLTTSGYRNQIYFQIIHWRWHASKCCINISVLKYNALQ